MASEKHTFHPVIDSRRDVKNAVDSYEVRTRPTSVLRTPEAAVRVRRGPRGTRSDQRGS